MELSILTNSSCSLNSNSEYKNLTTTIVSIFIKLLMRGGPQLRAKTGWTQRGCCYKLKCFLQMALQNTICNNIRM
jgi:hypothetical protein